MPGAPRRSSDGATDQAAPPHSARARCLGWYLTADSAQVLIEAHRMSYRALFVIIAITLSAAESDAHMAPHARIEALTLALERRPGDARLYIERAEANREDGHPAEALLDL